MNIANSVKHENPIQEQNDPLIDMTVQVRIILVPIIHTNNISFPSLINSTLGLQTYF